MATRTNFEGSNEIGVFSALTNSYCLSGTTETGVVGSDVVDCGLC